MHDDNGGGDRGGGADRRTFLKLTGALTAAGGGLLGGASSAAAETSEGIESLVESMTLEQKVARTHGASVEGAPEGIAGSVRGVDSLGIPPLDMADGPPGASIGVPATDFPHPVSTASTFDPDLVAAEGSAIAAETKAWGVDVHLAPSMDAFRVPFSSRAGESYGEDPVLSAAMAAAYTGAIQDGGVIATLKHFVGYNQTRTTGPAEDGFSISEHNDVVGERALREIYFPAFKAAVREGDAGAVMPAYNMVNATFCSQNAYLLEEILKGEWGFDGVVVSDWGGTHSTVTAARNGLDIEMPSENYFGGTLAEAVENGDLDESVVDDMVLRGLRSQRDIGALSGDREGVGDESVIGSDDHRALARRMAEDGSVLLKNDGVLPFDDAEVDSLALVGPTPTAFKQDVGGSDAITGTPDGGEVGPVEGLDRVVGGSVSVETASTSSLEPVSADDGFAYEYYDTDDLGGEPTATGTTETVGAEDAEFASARWEGTVTPDEGGLYGLSFTSRGQGYVYVDGELVGYNEPAGFVIVPERSSVELEAGTAHEVVVEVHGPAPAALEWNPPSAYADAAPAAADADAAVVLARTYTNYGDDRYKFNLPEVQNEVIRRVAAANENTVVLLNTETAVELPWVDDVPALMEVWYPGQEAGTAVANLLFGESTPSAKTPITFAESYEDYLPQEINTLPENGRGYPGIEGDVYYDEGVFVGYRHFDAAGVDPVFPFGHGESYAEFAYGDASVSTAETTADEGATVSVDVTNAGEYDGAETVQVYLAPTDSPVERPPKELAGFDKRTVPAGTTETFTVEVGGDAFRYWDEAAGEWAVDAGEYRVLVAASSRDVRAETTLTVADDDGSETTHYQVDFAAGEPIEELGEEGLYAEQDRLMRFAFGSVEEGITEKDTAWPSAEIRDCVEYGHIREHDDGTASVTFSVADDCDEMTLSLAVYSMPGDEFSADTADEQELLNATTGTFGPGDHTITVDLPDGNESDD
ncbi:glycoside hydrolase family 3 N-terminal domain-containing protein [Candidatus Halobonum tyrrellensis]|uniref:Beta-glucosidase n=1 Tax=Candidatus Halobonum tyrrellensis G22 TaxID=1324957 RepID=V4HDV5_9EURY|nr:glycoside hydrolase family 3 N-terminal domain-containing protein [Candidatus Halobonum tyrrellensis]ESP88835.1 beta-glucosidase [Candidatus Halobonum tyrrellensis G22]